MTALRFDCRYSDPVANSITALEWTFPADRPQRDGGFTLCAPCDLPTSIAVTSDSAEVLIDTSADGQTTIAGILIQWQRTTGPDSGLAVTFSNAQETTP